MTVRSGDMSDLFKKPVGRSARQVSRGHGRDRETITTMHDDKGPGLVMGDSVPYQLFFHQGRPMPSQCTEALREDFPRRPPCTPRRHTRMFGHYKLDVYGHRDPSIDAETSSLQTLLGCHNPDSSREA